MSCTVRLDQAVKNNPGKFPEGYIFTVQSSEKQEPVKNFDRFNKFGKVTKELQTTGTETSFEINLFSVVKIKQTTGYADVPFALLKNADGTSAHPVIFR